MLWKRSRQLTLTLDQDVRKCQDNEPIFNCTTRNYINAIMSKCKCMPSNLRLSDKVWNQQNFSSIIYWYKYFKDPVCYPLKQECVTKIPIDTSGCMKPCSGLIVTSFAKLEKPKNLELLYPQMWRQYNNFKIISTYPPGLIGIQNFCRFFF